MTNPFNLVKTRADFFAQLDVAIAKTQQLIAQDPNFGLLHSIAQQLDAMKQWTKNGRKPTFDERKSISMRRTVMMELQGADLEYEQYKHPIGELASYFKYWRSDAGLDSMDLDDWRIDFDDEYDLSDE